MTSPAGAERRSDPRFAAHLRLRVRDVEMFTANISRSGMQIACAVTLATIIQRDLDDGRLRLELELPGGDRCTMESEVRYATEVDDEILIGVRHMDFPGGGMALYHAFCDEAAGNYRAV